jgi:hypothetical protein
VLLLKLQEQVETPLPVSLLGDHAKLITKLVVLRDNLLL